MIDFYNSEVRRYQLFCANKTKDEQPSIDEFINTDTTKISWNRSLKADLGKGKLFNFRELSIVSSMYRPFSKQIVYFNPNLNAYVNQIPRIFPNAEAKNQVIYLSGSGNSGKEFSALVTDAIPDLNMQHSGGQGFPEYIYEAGNQIDSTAQHST
ncbi:MAG TPA: hypothetical protein DCG63_01400, partial [Methylophilaceae bacterium]|nr:hypothetical protein [Methylophilaceae bacterium]